MPDKHGSFCDTLKEINLRMRNYWNNQAFRCNIFF